MEKNISKSVLERLPLYLNYLLEIEDEVKNISATTISKELGLGEVQVRKDLALVSDGGRPRTGYITKELIEDISQYLGCNNVIPAVIVGAGKIGRAILGYEGFTRYGVDIKAAFGHHANKNIELESTKPILDLSQFGNFCEANDIEIGIITVPAAYAQEICDLMVSCGIKAIWNFARKTLTVPPGVIVRQEDLAASIAILACKLKNKEKEV